MRTTGRRQILLSPIAAVAPALLARPRSDWVATRPRLYFDRHTAGRLRERIQKDAGLRERWAKLLARAKYLLDSHLIPEEVAEQGGGQHANYGLPSGQVFGMGLTLGLAYHVGGEKQYADKLRDALLYYARYQRWGGQGLAERVPPWHSELNTARFCCWSRSALSPASR